MSAQLEIDLTAIRDNAAQIVALASDHEIDIWGVTKGAAADLEVAKAMLDGGVVGLADARLANLEQLATLNSPLLLLRIPSLSEVGSVVELADISLNSELQVIQALNQAAQVKDKLHQVILLVDLGDRREGLLPEELFETIHKVKQLSNIKLVGLGTNLACLRGVLPTADKMQQLAQLVARARQEFALELPVISGGNSSSLPLLLEDDYQASSNQLRVGETILLGRQVPGGQPFTNTSQDTFRLKAEVIELKEKPTGATDQVGPNAFAETKEIVDKGVRQRAILAVGRQDISPQGLVPLDKGLTIEGASSDHLILDVPASRKLALGDQVEFKLDYAALLQAVTSPYVEKVYQED
ncbi:alanine/ornithine racemase family PLP-dependent enzyme [Halanaerobaculum tunisiense]